MGKTWVNIYVGADLGLYLMIKILRGDFWYWVPAGGFLEFVLSIVGRIMVKVITDFTSIVQFRHPNELGGMYWSFGFVFTMGSLPVAIRNYEKQGGDKKTLDLVLTLLYIFMTSNIIMFGVFFNNIDKKYRQTFVSMERGKDLTVRRFQHGNNEEMRADAILNNSRHHWKSIEEEVKSWVESNWSSWEEEKPKWLTDAMRARVPEEFIPADGDARRRESVRRASVDAGAEGGLAGALRAGIRRASVGGADGRFMEGVGGGKAKVSSVMPVEEEGMGSD
jgi:hypothetical protein